MPDSDTDGATTTTATATVGPPVIGGLDPIEQLTPVSGEGSRPLLTWAPVDGAAAYLVMVYDGEWSPVLVDDHFRDPDVRRRSRPDSRRPERPRISDGYSWSVYTDDAGGVIIAASPLRAIAP